MMRRTLVPVPIVLKARRLKLGHDGRQGHRRDGLAGASLVHGHGNDKCQMGPPRFGASIPVFALPLDKSFAKIRMFAFEQLDTFVRLSLAIRGRCKMYRVVMIRR